jgi:DNA polymerase III subunit alpha
LGDAMYTHLHLHTEYSLLDGFTTIRSLMDQTKAMGMQAIAITDHGTMFGVIDFYKEAKKKNIKPIIGCEVYTAPRSMTDKDPSRDKDQGHLVLLAKNNQGYQNLIKLVSMGFLEGFYYKPRIDYEVLEKHTEGLICLSACLAGDIQQHLMNQHYEEAKQLAVRLQTMFGKDHFYLELQDHGIEEQKLVNQELIRMSRDTGIPLVATNDVHYIRQEDAEAHDILLCIQTGKVQDDQDRMKFPNDAFYLKSEEEMRALFPAIPEAIDNSWRIAERCDVTFDFNTIHLPDYQPPADKSLNEYLEELCLQGLERRFPNADKTIRDRLNYELSTIFQMEYTEYFLIVWDFIKYAQDHGIPVGPGRGSAAGSLVAYALGITDIDPLRYQLIFERFLNPERISMPDIDIDFCYERRDEVINYVKEKYGADRVAQIITFGTMAARAAIRDVGRVISMPYGDVDQIAKMIPLALGMTIDKALEMNPQLLRLTKENEQAKYLINMARKLEGMPRHASTHAAGVVISRKKLNEHVPLYMHENSISTQYPMGIIEELGLLKMDFLGLRTLTVIQEALDILRRENIELSFSDSLYEDTAAYELISRGDTLGVFQLESAGMIQFMKELKPNGFEDVIAGISLFRPGPMESIPRYIRNKNQPEKVRYLHESLEPILNVTYGCLVYQEQVMQVVRDLAGYSYGRSDLVRRAMSKKKMDVMEEERKNFIYGKKQQDGTVEIEGCVSKGIPADIANRIYDEMIDFAKYAFNKSHAAAYAVLAYQTAYLKAHHPVAFMAALMTSVMGNSLKIAEYIHDCKRMGIEVLPPDINSSYSHFSVEGTKIRFGMAAVKNVGAGMIDQMVIERQQNGSFQGFSDFCERLNSKELNKRAVESMIKAGAYDSLGVARAQLMAVFEQVLESAARNRKNNLQGQLALFELDQMQHHNQQDHYPDVEDFPERIRLSMEKEVLGLYLSGHPLAEYQEVLTDIITGDSADFNELVENPLASRLKDRQTLVLGGVIMEKTMKTTRNNQMMAFIQLEDLFGTIECILFPQTLEQYLPLVQLDEIVIVEGTLDFKDEEAPKVLVSHMAGIQTIDEWKNRKSQFRRSNRIDKSHDSKKVESSKEARLWIKIPEAKHLDLIEKVKPLLKQYQGSVPVIIYIEATKQRLQAEESLWVKYDMDLIGALQKVFGETSVKMT